MTPSASQILHGLHCEWQCAVEYLPQPFRLALRLPAFELDDMASYWGVWRRDRRTIVLSRKLVREFAWESIREVLLHEMAHQLTDECLGGDVTPHGARFHEACRLLKADPSASSDAASIHQRIEEHSDEGEGRIMTRVRKLLAMAHGGGCNEADVAMAKVHDLMAKHNLSLFQSAEKPEFHSMTIGEPVMRFAAEDYHMLSLLRDFYFVGTVVIPAYVISKGKMGRVAEVSGRMANLKMARYVHAFLHRTVDEQWAELGGSLRNSRRRKTDFAVGLIRGFQDRLETRKGAEPEAAGATTALAILGKREVDAYLKRRYTCLRRTSGRGRAVDEGVIAAGVEVGRRTVLSKPIEGGTNRRGLLLE